MVYYSTELNLYPTEIDPRRNLFIDDIEQYIDSLDYQLSLSDFKRFTPSESVTVKIPVSDAQSALGGYLATRYNYASVVYEDDSARNSFTWYYFISSIEMIADGTLSVTLQLDALNTFRNWKGALTDRTFVTRQLINRWDSKNDLLTPEDISGDIVKTEEFEISPTPCYLIYDSIDSTPSLKVETTDGIYVSTRARVDDSVIRKSSQDGQSALWFHILEAGARITINYRASSTSTMQTISYTSTTSNLYVGVATGLYSSGRYASNLFITDGSSLVNEAHVTSTVTPSFDYAEIIIRCSSLIYRGTGALSLSRDSTSGALKSISVTAIGDEMTTSGLGTIDRTSSKLVKIIEIPFKPNLASYGEFEITTDGIRLVFDDVEAQLSYSFDSAMTHILDYSKPSSYADKAEAMASDPKILTGAYSYYKVVYDSYSCVINYENVSKNAGSILGTWTASSSMSSSCIVRFEQASEGWLNVTEDYPFMLSSDRNNEIPLYSSDWLNYLRNGYNYDKKSNAMSIATSVLSTVGSLIMGVVSIASGGTTAAATVPAAIGMAGAAWGGWTNTASTINSQLAKETQLKNQSYSVSSINDLSLFKVYGNAAIKIEWWEPRSDYAQRLQTLFFYRGYSIGRQYKPSLSIRTSFDYIECVPSWSGSFIQRTPPQFISLLNDRLAQGVTIIHHYDNAWDIAQEKGNIEA